MLRQVEHEAAPAESVTETVAAPSLVVAATDAVAVMLVELTTLTVDTVTPLTVSLAPLTNPVPVTLTLTPDAPRVSVAGENFVTVTAGATSGYSWAQPPAGTNVPSTTIADEVVL